MELNRLGTTISLYSHTTYGIFTQQQNLERERKKTVSYCFQVFCFCFFFRVASEATAIVVAAAAVVLVHYIRRARKDRELLFHKLIAKVIFLFVSQSIDVYIFLFSTKSLKRWSLIKTR